MSALEMIPATLNCWLWWSNSFKSDFVFGVKNPYLIRLKPFILSRFFMYSSLQDMWHRLPSTSVNPWGMVIVFLQKTQSNTSHIYINYAFKHFW